MIMVNKREQLKQEIARDLSRKIDATQQLLKKLKTAQEDVKNDCENAKLSFQKSVDDLIQALTYRKAELSKQVDLLCQQQSNSLQESIQAASIALGSLQSTLSNLDSFDNGQLVNLAIPDYLWNNDDVQVSNLEVDSECTQLRDEISIWGSVKSLEFQNTIKTSSASILPPSVEATTSAMDQMFSLVGTEFDSDIEAWLCKSESRAITSSSSSSDEDEDFEIIPADKQQVENEDIFHELNKSSSQNQLEEEEKEQEEELSSGISIINLNTSTNTNTESTNNENSPDVIPMPKYSTDLSQWLKPKRTTTSNTTTNCTLSDATNNIVPTQMTRISVVPEELAERFAFFSLSTTNPSTGGNTTPMDSGSLIGADTIKTATKKTTSSIASKRKYLDFPCLRMDPKCWLQKKRAAICADVCFNIGQKEIIPPTYALPYPFWLKKC